MGRPALGCDPVTPPPCSSANLLCSAAFGARSTGTSTARSQADPCFEVGCRVPGGPQWSRAVADGGASVPRTLCCQREIVDAKPADRRRVARVRVVHTGIFRVLSAAFWAFCAPRSGGHRRGKPTPVSADPPRLRGAIWPSRPRVLGRRGVRDTDGRLWQLRVGLRPCVRRKRYPRVRGSTACISQETYPSIRPR